MCRAVAWKIRLDNRLGLDEEGSGSQFWILLCGYLGAEILGCLIWQRSGHELGTERVDQQEDGEEGQIEETEREVSVLA